MKQKERKGAPTKSSSTIFGMRPREAFVFLLLLVLVTLFYTQQINFVVADLGRHIQNGELFINSLTIPSTNFYSYTNSYFSTVTHHWGSGVIYYCLWYLAEFEGLTMLNVALYLIAFCFIFSLSYRLNGFSTTLLLSLLALPLLASRPEIRPEVFSYLFISIYIWFLYPFKQGLMRYWSLALLPFLQLLWVNLHLFFVMGPFLIGVFIVDQFINEKNGSKIKALVYVLIASILACLANPFGLKGLLEPFLIFREYGYMIAENQSVLFMQDRFNKLLYYHVEITLLIALFSIVYVIYRRKYHKYFISILLLVVYGVLAFIMIRNFPMFGLLFIPFAGQQLQDWVDSGKYTFRKRFPQAALGLAIFLMIISASGRAGYLSPNYQAVGLGLLPNSNKAARFYQQYNLPGKIFNNYDIGSYLTYHLYPDLL
ncbi:MAG: hypothetical protein BRD50_08875 [Bacteroidetes bacterium SW_11_45_7]|nr:MAG: hypothetical protein BRD50_08875 [Bacteroidetes bacterium SW_11_45_7]